ncbi:MAG TPA: carboxypeptidase regulatory-like domain-containing protein [Polyangia bacterium]|nr:carboxypeptidase regulatory-like domain-containing protein [Polyangia bacterium]
MRRLAFVVTGSLAVVCGVAAGCNTAGIRGDAGVGTGLGGGTGTDGGPGGSMTMAGTGGTIISVPKPTEPCENLVCRESTCTKGACTVPACPGGARTTVSGTIKDPAGKNPLYNITVYVPNKALDPLVDGPSCDPCDRFTGTSNLSGEPVTITKTDTAGRFMLGAKGNAIGGDVPAGDNVPLVIQVGKWRRQVMIPHVQACTNTELTDANMLRLPRSQAEGHIPKMALTTGQRDAMECLLRKVGIDDSEFTPEAGTGRINFYAGGGGTAGYAPTMNMGAAFTPVNPWWDSFDNLKKYDILLHSCEGNYGSYAGVGDMPQSVKSAQAVTALHDYANMGGRVFASHWHAYWFENGPPDFQSIATFLHRGMLPNPYLATIDQNFTTGQAMAMWMVTVMGSPMPGFVSIAQDANPLILAAAAGGNTSQRWIYAADRDPQSVQYLSATTPVPGGKCGRVVLSDLHVSSGGANSDIPSMPFPTGCVTTDLSPQEKVLEFMLFDIASCVTPLIP